MCVYVLQGRVADAALDSSTTSSESHSSMSLISSSVDANFSSAIANTCMEGIMHLLICSR